MPLLNLSSIPLPRPLRLPLSLTLAPSRRPYPRGYSSGGHSTLCFRDGAAFRLKTLGEILRGLLVLKFCSYPALVNNSETLMRVARRVLGKWAFDRAMRVTAYGQFVAGESEGEIGRRLRTLRELRIRPMLAVPLEDDIASDKSESGYENNLREMLKCVDLSVCSQYHSLMQLKVTALMSAELCRKLTLLLTQSPPAWDLAVHRLMEVMEGQDLAFPSLTECEAQQLRTSLNRLNSVGQYASERGVRVLVDAEYTYLNPAISLVTKALMGRFNQSEPTVWNTYQCYLKDSYRVLLADLEWASNLGLCFGVKLVRGAYMSKERELARALSYPDPIQPSWEATNESYKRILDHLLSLIAERGDRCSIIIATHNEDSVHHTLNRMKDLGISPDNDSLSFAQLLGMCDHISLTLGSAGYSVYKSIPYGSVEEVMPYLVRRAQENLSVLNGLRAEKDLLWAEFWKRLTRRRKNPR